MPVPNGTPHDAPTNGEALVISKFDALSNRTTDLVPTLQPVGRTDVFLRAGAVQVDNWWSFRRCRVNAGAGEEGKRESNHSQPS